MKPKERLDVLLTERGLAESREKAQQLIRAGLVSVGGARAEKPGVRIDAAADVTVRAGPRYVSRGGEKLDAALRYFSLDVTGWICLDVGSSTGGFTDCLLQRGAARVYAVDVGRGLLHWRLQQDARVVLKEGLNARFLRRESIPDRPRLAVVDVSFISLTKVLPAVIQTLDCPARLIALIKPQFEAGRREVGRGGVVREAAVRDRVVDGIVRFGVRELGLTGMGVCESPLKGPAGNVEYLACWFRNEQPE
jgi:23S rRNA (cytidine1920-2'-O)/16S rRNA (cytidine1409-2'-O)-methyltransferase